MKGGVLVGNVREEGVSAEPDCFGTGRRIGWAFDRFLVYGTGGVAFGEVESAGDIELWGRNECFATIHQTVR